MGQASAPAAVDLPDPKDALPAPGNSADDLLAQLAGEEIDRLLSEDSDSEPISEPVASVTPQVEAAKESAQESADEIDAVLSAAQNPTPAEIKIEAKADPAPAPTSQVAAPVELPDDSSSVDEMRELLNDKSIGTTVERVPIYVRALELINSPFNKLPESVRETIGKVAILTLFNSVAVLMYVLIFRHHK